MEDQALAPTFSDPEMVRTEQLARTLVASGFFRDVGKASQAIVKIVAARDLGIGPIPAMTGIHIVEGKIELGANILATLVKRSGRYNYRVAEHTDEKCAIDFFERIDGGAFELIGTTTFTMADATRAKLVRGGSAWEKFPRSMLFARAISEGVRTHCPDVSAGNTVYVEGELSGDATGEIVASEPEGFPELPTTVVTSGGPIDDPIGDVQAAMPSLERPVLVPPPVAKATPAQLAEIMAYRKELLMSRDEALALIGLPPVAEGERIDLSQDQATALIVALAERGDR